MRSEIAHPCCGPSAIALRINRSSVPCGSSTRADSVTWPPLRLRQESTRSLVEVQGKRKAYNAPDERRCTMRKQVLAGFALAAALTWTSSAQDAKAVVANASKAMGVDTLKTVQYSATGLDFALGQAPNPSRSEEHTSELQ